MVRKHPNQSIKNRRFGFSDSHRLCYGAYAPEEPAPLLLTPKHPQDFVKKKLLFLMLVLRALALAAAITVAAPDPALFSRSLCDHPSLHRLFCPFGEER
jgi:hypothetical protein